MKKVRLSSALIALAIIAIFGYTFVTKSSSQEKSICGGSVEQATFDKLSKVGSGPEEELLQTGTQSRSLGYDYESNLLFIGNGADASGGILAVDMTSHYLETCMAGDKRVASGTNVSVNASMGLGEKKTLFATDKDGAWMFDSGAHSWTHYGELSGLTDLRGYAFSRDDRQKCPVLSTWSGVFCMDNQQWRPVDDNDGKFASVQPPVSPRNYAALLVTNDGWFFGTMHNGFYRYFDQNWEHFSSAGYERWVDGSWQQMDFDLSSFDEIRDFGSFLFEGSIAIVGDQEVGGLQIINFHQSSDPHDYTSRKYVDESVGLGHLGSVEVISDYSFVVTSYQPRLGKGVFFYQTPDAPVVTAVKGSAYDAMTVNGYTYVAVSRGVERMKFDIKDK